MMATLVKLLQSYTYRPIVSMCKCVVSHGNTHVEPVPS